MKKSHGLRLQRFQAGMEAIFSNANRHSGLCTPLTRGTRNTRLDGDLLLYLGDGITNETR